MLGPLSILLTFVAVQLPLPLSLSATLGLLLAWKLRMRGFYLALLPLGASLYFCDGGLHYLAAGSLLLGLWITAQSLEEHSERRSLEIDKQEEERNALQQTFETALRKASRDLSDERRQHEERLEQLEKERNAEKKQAELFAIEGDQWKEEAERIKEESANLLRKKAHEFSEELQRLKGEREDLEKAKNLIERSLEEERVVYKEKRAELESSLAFYKKENEQLALLSRAPPHESERLYKQLKEQFEERNEVLFQTRKQLFNTENTLLALEREQRERALEPSNDEIELFNRCRAYTAECAELQVEVAELQQIISTLLTAKKSTRVKKGEQLQASFI